MTPLGEWTPDLPHVLGPKLIDAKNVIPHPGGYKPFKDLTNGTTALAAEPRGGASYRDSALNSHIYAGSATKLYELASDGSWTDRTRLSGGDYATTTNETWSFTQFGDLCIASNWNDAIQSLNMSSGSNFAALSGSPPKCRHIATFGDFVFLGNTENSVSQIKWSAINDATGWTDGTDQAGSQTFPDGGAVQGFAAHDTLTVFQRFKIRRLQYVGGAVIMQIDVISEEKGAIVDGAICSQGAISFFLANDGFYALAGDQLIPIGADKVDEWFFADVNQSYIHKMTSEVDPQSKVAYWSYASTSSVNGIPDTLLMYNWTAKRWAYARITVERLLNIYGLGYTLDGLDTLTTNIDNFDIPFDDPVLTGGTLQLNGFGSTYQLGPFSGSTLEATVESGDFELVPGRRSYVSGVEPVIDTTSATIAVAAKARLGATASYDGAMSQEANGFTSQDASGRYHRVKMGVPAAATWNDASAFNFEVADDGQT